VDPRLDSPKAYEHALNALAKKWSARGRLDKLSAYGVTLADLRGRTQAFSRVLAKTIKRGEFRFSALTAVSANIDGKVRTLYRPNLVDAVVLAVTAKYLAAVAEPSFSPALHSFRKGHSSTKTVRLVSQYFNQHCAQVPLRQRGLYVLQRDITRYGESIDNSPGSALFEQVGKALQADPNPAHRHLAQTLIQGAILQPILGHDGTEKPLECGVPTGSPIQTVCANLYLAKLDARLDQIPGAFYARFGDDLLFIHPEHRVSEWASAEIEQHFSDLKLQSKIEKKRSLYVNGAGRPSPVDAQYKPATQIEYLGLRVHFSGSLGLKRERERELQTQLLRRFRHVRDTAMFEEPSVLARLLCAVVSKALEPSQPLAIAVAERLRHSIDDRGQLRDLDYRVALMVAETATGRRGPRAFRTISYRKLRQMGLTSLVVNRHRKGAARA